MKLVRMFGDLDHESELLKNSLLMFVSKCQTILKTMGQRITFDRVTNN